MSRRRPLLDQAIARLRESGIDTWVQPTRIAIHTQQPTIWMRAHDPAEVPRPLTSFTVAEVFTYALERLAVPEAAMVIIRDAHARAETDIMDWAELADATKGALEQGVATHQAYAAIHASLTTLVGRHPQ